MHDERPVGMDIRTGCKHAAQMHIGTQRFTNSDEDLGFSIAKVANMAINQMPVHEIGWMWNNAAAQKAKCVSTISS